MGPSDRPEPSNRTARLAAAYYLFCALTAPFVLIYVPSKLFSGDPAATARNLLASEGLLRWSLFGGLIADTAFALAVLTLYRLFTPVSRALSQAMVFLALVAAPLGLLEAAEQLTALQLLHGAGRLAVLAPAQREGLAMLMLSLRGSGVTVAELFWGLWLFPLGVLVIRSRFLPRWLGALLVVNGMAYVAVAFSALVQPAYEGIVSRVATVPEFGELVFILWLLIRGIRLETSPQAATAPA